MKLSIRIPTLMFVAASAAPAANILVNGSFETGLSGYDNIPVPSELGWHRYGPASVGNTAPTGWTKTDRIWTCSDLAGDPFPESNGNYAMRLDANAAGGQDILSQSGIHLDAGHTYEFAIDMWSDNVSDPSDLTVQFTGTMTIPVLTSYVDNIPGIERVIATFTPTVTGTYDLEIFNSNELTDTNNNHTWVDNASLEVTAIPEPSAPALCIAGCLLALSRRWRNTRP